MNLIELVVNGDSFNFHTKLEDVDEIVNRSIQHLNQFDIINMAEYTDIGIIRMNGTPIAHDVEVIEFGWSYRKYE